MIDASWIESIAMHAAAPLGIGLFMLLLTYQITSSVDQDPKTLHLRHPPAVRWLGILCAVFFSFCFVMALQAHFERPDQQWAFLYFPPFILLGLYLYIESFATITLRNERLISKSLLFSSREFSWNNIKDYKYNPILQYHYFIFPDGRKLGFSPYMIGASTLLDMFAAKYRHLI